MSDKIVYYDETFMEKFNKLGKLLEEKDWRKLYDFLLEEFGFIFKLQQYYGKYIIDGTAKDFEEADEDVRRELMRPLSHRQYRMTERAFNYYREFQDEVVWAIWDFLHDNDRIYEKKVMSAAEVGCCSLILERVYICLSHLVDGDGNKSV